MSIGKSIKFGATLMRSDLIEADSISEYQFDLLPANKPRVMWLHKNQSESNGQDNLDRLACTMPVP